MPYRDDDRAVQNRSHQLAQPISGGPLACLDDVEYVTMQWVYRYNNLRTRRSATSRLRATPPLAAT
jgi:hypothetical protein